MNWPIAIIQAVIIAGLTSLINYIIFKRQRRIDFTFDYKKHILDKRKEAYDKVGKFINMVLDTGRIGEMRSDMQKVNFKEYRELMEEFDGFIDNYGMWVSHEIRGYFVRIFALVKFIEDGYKKSQLTDKDAQTSWFEIINLKSSLEHKFFQDLTSLDSIDQFINQRNKELQREAGIFKRPH